MNDQTPIQYLVEIPQSDAFAVFAAPRLGGEHPIDPILAKVRQEVDAFKAEVPDLATPAGRKRISSMAYRITQSKTALEKVGKGLAAEAKDVPKRIDATRRYIEQTLDAWRDEVRQPLTAWEIAEDARVAAHSAALARINSLAATDPTTTAAEMAARIAELEAVDASPAHAEEFATEYKIAVDAALPKLIAMHAKQVQHERDQAELKRLRAESDARAKAEREESLRREGEERARLEAEADARAERERVAREQENARLDAARKEAEHKAQIAALEQKAVEAAAAERQRITDEKAKAAEDAAARERNRTHRAKVNSAAVDAFVANGADKDTAVFIVTLIAKGKIPGIAIQY